MIDPAEEEIQFSDTVESESFQIFLSTSFNIIILVLAPYSIEVVPARNMTRVSDLNPVDQTDIITTNENANISGTEMTYLERENGI